MAIVQCVCGARIEAGGPDALAASYRAHAAQAHPSWPLTDEDLASVVSRQAERPQWDGQRRVLPGALRFEQVGPANADAFLNFFDGPGFMDNPTWADCYCNFFHFPGTSDEWACRSAAANREAQMAAFGEGRAQGYLALAGDELVGWCNAGPRSGRPGLARSADFASDSDPAATGAVVCFVVAAPYRGQGVARALLEAACDGLAASGMHVVEAFPARQATSDARSYMGPLALYLDAGFRVVREGTDHLLVRRELAAR